MITLAVDDSVVPESARLGPRYDAIGVAVSQALPLAPEGVVDVVYVSESEIRRLNRMYRGKDMVTDVLSFASAEEFPERQENLGDVLICYEQALRQSEEENIVGECVDLVVHGVLHVLGYDHERPEDAAAMFPLQDAIVDNVQRLVLPGSVLYSS